MDKSGTITVADRPDIQDRVGILNVTTILIAVNYHKTGKDLILGSFNWGWDSNKYHGSSPAIPGKWIYPISPSDGVISDRDIKILDHYYPEYSFFNF